MDSSWFCYGVLGVWCNLNISSLDSLPRPPIFGEMVKSAQISPKIRWCPHSPTSHSQTAQLMKTGKYSFDRGIITLHFGEKKRKSPFTHFGGSLVDWYKFYFKVSLATSPLALSE